MPVIVFAWTDSTSGHASLSIEGHAGANSDDSYATYISFYPDPRRTNVQNTGIKQMALKGIPGTPTTMTQNLHSDVNGKRRVPQFASGPINGLNEENMIEFWANFRSQNPTWSLTKNSCADVVFQTLEAGGAGEKSLIAKAVISAAKHQYVTVRDCIWLARVLED